MMIKSKLEQSKYLINAILTTEKEWPNNMDLGYVVRSFVHKIKDHELIDDKQLYDLLIELSTKLKPCAL